MTLLDAERKQEDVQFSSKPVAAECARAVAAVALVFCRAHVLSHSQVGRDAAANVSPRGENWAGLELGLPSRRSAQTA